MILKLKLFQAIFCASLPNRSAIASLCKTNPIPVPVSLKGKTVVEATESSTDYHASKRNNTSDENNHQPHNLNGKHHANNQHQPNSGSRASATSGNQSQEVSTKKSDYLF
jgi:hypothetical protein